MITKKHFGVLPNGEEVVAYTLTNGSILSYTVLNYGGIVKNILVEDKNGRPVDVVGGYDELEGYLTASGYQGALIGRTGNRISRGRFVLDGRIYHLYCNDGENSLHGGQYGFNTKIWSVEESGTEEEPALVLRYTSPDGEENYPGTLQVKVTYTLTGSAGMKIRYEAETDKATIVNLTNHSYFNLRGFDGSTVDEYLLWLDADAINSVDQELIPDGNLLSVSDTDYDFRRERPLGDGFVSSDRMLKLFGGYDHNFVFQNRDGSVKKRATLRDPKTGFGLTMFTDQPCVQIYTGNMVNPADHPFKKGVTQYRHCAVCMETQAMPDAINHPKFTDTVLRPGEKYDTTTIYEFES